MRNIIILFLSIISFGIIMYVYFRENFNGVFNQNTQICSQCGNRIVTGTVYASPDHTAGLGWIN
jgi:nitrogen fixation protein FixH